MSKRKSFTLAELLITLTVIGCLALMTIPQLLQDAQDAHFKKAWKEAYSIIGQAYTKVMLDQAGTLKGVCATNNNNCLRNLFRNHLIYTKSCDDGLAHGECWADAGVTKYFNGVYPPAAWFEEAALVLSNGIVLQFNYTNSSCAELDGTTYQCGYIVVDVNGLKPPNTYARDIFFVHLKENSISPFGGDNDTAINCGDGKQGWDCAMVYLKQ